MCPKYKDLGVWEEAREPTSNRLTPSTRKLTLEKPLAPRNLKRKNWMYCAIS